MRVIAAIQTPVRLAIGLACGVENYALAAMVTAFALFILVVMGRVEDWWAPR